MREKCKECGDRLFKIVDGKILCRKGHVHAVYGGKLSKEGFKAAAAGEPVAAKKIAINTQQATAKPALATAGQSLEGQDVKIEVRKVPKRSVPDQSQKKQ